VVFENFCLYRTLDCQRVLSVVHFSFFVGSFFFFFVFEKNLVFLFYFTSVTNNVMTAQRASAINSEEIKSLILV